MARKKKSEIAEPEAAAVQEIESVPAAEAVSEVAAVAEEAVIAEEAVVAETGVEAVEEPLPAEESAEEEAEADAEVEAAEDEDAESEDADEDEDAVDEDEAGEDEDDEDFDGDEDDEDAAEDEDEDAGEAAADEDDEDVDEDDGEPEEKAKPRPPAKLERLQKILAQAGVASRRSAEEMIEQGRVQVNGQVVTTLGSKADANRDHIRVDGKLLQGAERHRYFVLNKPKGFVTTVKDPEGRPTVMQFFEKMKERLYPVGRLDYLSEGLLLVTNDGDLAHKLTRAASGVEKTYLVKVAGQPTEDELDVLRGGVSIPQGKDGSKRVKTSPARIRQVKQGDNPWFEVILIEGRNRELRKMFEEIGHFVEKIRRVGYGPLVLDQEPGQMRELDEHELSQLRLAADGKLRKTRAVKSAQPLEKLLPTVRPRGTQPYGERSSGRGGDFRTQRGASQQYGQEASQDARPPRRDERFARPDEEQRPSRGDERRPGTFGNFRFGNKPGGSRFGSDRPGKPAGHFTGRPQARPAWQQENRPAPRPEGSFEQRGPGAGERRPAPSFGDRPRTYGDRPAGRSYGDKPAGRPYGDRPSAPRPAGDRPARPFGEKPAGRPFGDKNRGFGDKPERKGWQKPDGDERSNFKRPAPQRADDDYSDLEPRKPIKLSIEPVEERSSSSRPSRPAGVRPYTGRPSAPRAEGDRAARPFTPRPPFNRGGEDRPRPQGRPEYRSDNRPAGRPESFDRPERFERSDRPAKPARKEGERRFTTSSGIPRAGGPRPSSKHPKGSRPTTGGSRPGAGGNRSFGSKPGGGFSRPASGQSRPAFRRDEGEGAPRTPRPYTPRTEGASDYRPRSPKPFSDSSAPRGEKRTGWKPKPSFGGKPGGKPAGRPGGFSKSGPKPGGFKSGPRPGGKRPGGAPGGKKRG
jgi:23S rRNA pseudouridine2605 synthase